MALGACYVNARLAPKQGITSPLENAKSSDVQQRVLPSMASFRATWELKNRKRRQIRSLLLPVFFFSLLVFIVSTPRGHSNADSSKDLKNSTVRSVNPPPLLSQAIVPADGIHCDPYNYRTAVCRLVGDVRVQNTTVALMTFDSSSNQEDVLVQKIKPYPRKWQKELLKKITEVFVKSLPAQLHRRDMVCQVVHPEPALIFSTGGYTGSVYHDFNDGLIPLYITSRNYQANVVFMILEHKGWWMRKYGNIVKQLTKFPVINLFNTPKVHCFSEVTVGLRIHDELAISPTKMKSGESMRDFQSILVAAFSNGSTQASVERPRRPRLILITRKRTRAFRNEKAIIKLATEVGFDVQAVEPGLDADIATLYRTLHSADVLVGVHGAALTHLLFMRPGTILLQVVPLGTESPSLSFYGKPAMKAGLQYMEYRISPSESSLRGWKNETRADQARWTSWSEMKKIYLDKQNVTISLSRFRPVLKEALDRITG